MSMDMNAAPVRMARRESRVEMPAPYDGFAFQLWVNAPQRLWNEVASGDDERGKTALMQLVSEHNGGLLDFDGQPLPPASEKGFWDAIPTEMLAAMIVLANAEIARLPKSLALPTKRR